MKKSLFLSVILLILVTSFTNAQLGKFVNKVAKSVANDMLGKPEEKKADPEPPCACSQPLLFLQLGGDLKLDYKEITISISEDGSMLARNNMTGDFYIIKDGVTSGPYKSGDPHLSKFYEADDDLKGIDLYLKKYSQFISKAGDKYKITFAGKTYGPYAQITNFAVSSSRDKFAAIVTENVVATENDAEKMDAAIKNAKTDQEKMELSMKYAQQMQQNIMKGGGAASILPKLVTSIPGATFDPSMNAGGILSGDIKYNEIVIFTYNKILDLKGTSLATLKSDQYGADKIYLSSDNKRLAVYGSGTLVFSDNTNLTELFSPMLGKADGNAYLSYLYYSPTKNAIMQCKIPF